MPFLCRRREAAYIQVKAAPQFGRASLLAAEILM
jgi:hypothetical protein